jgi:hypothetical protein
MDPWDKDYIDKDHFDDEAWDKTYYTPEDAREQQDWGDFADFVTEHN